MTLGIAVVGSVVVGIATASRVLCDYSFLSLLKWHSYIHVIGLSHDINSSDLE